MTTELLYDPLTYELTQMKRDGNTVATLTHDNIGRVETFTDATGLTLTYEYNDLDQVTKIIYPDTRFEEFTYSTCCPRMIESITDRTGLTTNYAYDPLKRLIQVQGSEGIISFEYDANGNRTKLIDTDKKTTTFEYNLDNRLVKKIYPDGKFIEFTYDPAGLLTKVTNSRNIEINYPAYDPNHNLLTIDYSDTTPDVTFTYDDYNRFTTRTDGIGLYQYTYDANNRLTSIDGPWVDDTIIYQYNELSQLKNIIPQGGQTITYYYDYDPENLGDLSIGRLKDIQAGTYSYTYNYTGVNPLIQSLLIFTLF